MDLKEHSQNSKPCETLTIKSEKMLHIIVINLTQAQINHIWGPAWTAMLSNYTHSALLWKLFLATHHITKVIPI